LPRSRSWLKNSKRSEVPSIDGGLAHTSGAFLASLSTIATSRAARWGRVYGGHCRFRSERPIAVQDPEDDPVNSRTSCFKKRLLPGGPRSRRSSSTRTRSVYDYGETQDGDLFMVMELLAGRSLPPTRCSTTAVLGRADPGQSPCSSLARSQSASRRRRFHRDLKPANVICRSRCRRPRLHQDPRLRAGEVFAPEEPGSRRRTSTILDAVRAAWSNGRVTCHRSKRWVRARRRTDIFRSASLLFQDDSRGSFPSRDRPLMEIVNQHFTTAKVPWLCGRSPEHLFVLPISSGIHP